MLSGRKYFDRERNCHSSAGRISGSELSTHAASRRRTVAISSLKPSAAMTVSPAWSRLAASFKPLPHVCGRVHLDRWTRRRLRLRRGRSIFDLFEFVLRPTRLEGCSVSDAPEEGSRFIDERTVFGRRSPMALLGRVERRLDEIGLVPDKSFGDGVRIAQPSCEANPARFRRGAQRGVADRPGGLFRLCTRAQAQCDSPRLGPTGEPAGQKALQLAGDVRPIAEVRHIGRPNRCGVRSSDGL